MYFAILIALLVLEILLSLLVGYLVILTCLAFRAPSKTPHPAKDPVHHFLIIIPAHNEEKLLPDLLKNLRSLLYPRDLFSIYVVADNCTDRTAIVARDYGAVVRERENPDLLGKGYALQWLLDQCREEKVPHDAVVILDADSLISENFLSVMDVRLSRGERAIQAYYTVRDPSSSLTASIRFAALTSVHYLHPQGRMVLGGSAGLKGNGMVFTADLLKQFTWPGSITEDIELHMALVLQGERVTFAPDAIVYGEMPNTLAASKSQQTRWEGGRLQMAQKYLMPLFRKAWQEIKKKQYPQGLILLDAAAEHIIPPFSILLAASCLVALISTGIYLGRGWLDSNFLVGAYPASFSILNITFVLSIVLVLVQLACFIAGLLLVKAPKFIYRSLLFAPIYMVWKLWHYILIFLGHEHQGWVRTPRNEG